MEFNREAIFKEFFRPYPRLSLKKFPKGQFIDSFGPMRLSHRASEKIKLEIHYFDQNDRIYHDAIFHEMGHIIEATEAELHYAILQSRYSQVPRFVDLDCGYEREYAVREFQELIKLDPSVYSRMFTMQQLKDSMGEYRLRREKEKAEAIHIWHKKASYVNDILEGLAQMNARPFKKREVVYAY